MNRSSATDKHKEAALSITAKYRLLRIYLPHVLRQVCKVQKVCLLQHGGVNSDIKIFISFLSECKITTNFSYTQIILGKICTFLKYRTFFVKIVFFLSRVIFCMTKLTKSVFNLLQFFALHYLHYLHFPYLLHTFCLLKISCLHPKCRKCKLCSVIFYCPRHSPFVHSSIRL